MTSNDDDLDSLVKGVWEHTGQSMGSGGCDCKNKKIKYQLL